MNDDLRRTARGAVVGLAPPLAGARRRLGRVPARLAGGRADPQQLRIARRASSSSSTTCWPSRSASAPPTASSDIERVRQTLTSAVNLEKVVRSHPHRRGHHQPSADGTRGRGLAEDIKVVERRGQPVQDHRDQRPQRPVRRRERQAGAGHRPEADRHLPRGEPRRQPRRDARDDRVPRPAARRPRRSELEEAEQRRLAFEAAAPRADRRRRPRSPRSWRDRAPNCAASRPISPRRKARWPRSTASSPARRARSSSAGGGGARGALAQAAGEPCRPRRRAG